MVTVLENPQSWQIVEDIYRKLSLFPRFSFRRVGLPLVGGWMYQDWTSTHAGLLYIVVIVVTFTLAIISGIPTLLYEKKKMKQAENEDEV